MSEKLPIISLSVHHQDFNESLDLVLEWAGKNQPAYVCFANVHMTIEAYRDKQFLAQVENANLVLADGKPIAAACNLLYKKKQERISGMDFMPRLLERLNEIKGSVFFYGSTLEILEQLKQRLTEKYPDVIHAGSISPSFGPVNEEEVLIDIEKINRSEAQVIFVSLGCPKQEKWMATYSSKIKAVLLGVGAAFSVFAGNRKRAPLWMQKLALEWFFRLMQQPRQLSKRYFTTNFLFLFLLTREWLKKVFR
ncbi:MAG TPA: WecB/TagA/CpsF family glycosyltransferase [Chitinophagaceae bacterium]|nr:WecB/TagA/CpsF family glycosyltransferase [Chitinophagaceae bacterium]